MINLEYIEITWDGYAKELPNEILNFDKLENIKITKMAPFYKRVRIKIRKKKGYKNGK